MQVKTLVERKWTHGLSTRMANCLNFEFDSFEQFEKKMREDVLFLLKIPNVGRVGFTEICKWAGFVQPKEPQKKPSEKRIEAAIRLLEHVGYTVFKQ